MAFTNPSQRKAFFEKQKQGNNPYGNPLVSPMTMTPTNTPPSAPTPDAAKVMGLPRTPKFGRVRRLFKA